MTDRETLPTLVDEMWEENILPTLTEFLGIPSKSPNFDADWRQNGYLLQVIQLTADWCEQRDIPGLTTEILILKDQNGEDRTPLLYIEIPASEHGNQEETFLFYNHLDKQPECPGWSEGLEPFKGVRKGDKLYGRGAVDDGYAIFTKIAAIEALHKTGGSYPRCVGVVETSEESCSPDLPFYLDALSERIGTPSVVFVFDTMSGNYEQLWVTMSLRSILYANLRVDVLKEPSIIANANGIVPSSFRIMRQLLSRVEDEDTFAKPKSPLKDALKFHISPQISAMKYLIILFSLMVFSPLQMTRSRHCFPATGNLCWRPLHKTASNRLITQHCCCELIRP